MPRGSNEELERVQERTAELAAANRQLLAQIEERERVESHLAADAAAGGGRPAHLRGRPRLQQPADRGARQYRLSAKKDSPRRDRRPAAPAPRLYARGRRTRRQADRPAAVVFSPPAARAEGARPQRDRRRHARPVAEHDGRQHPDRDQAAPRSVVGPGRPYAARARRAQSRDQCARRDAGRRHAWRSTPRT